MLAPTMLEVLCASSFPRLPLIPRRAPATPPVRVGILGGGFAGLTAARTLVSHHPGIEVCLVDQREYFEYTPGILRAWVEPSEHKRLVNPIKRLLRSRRATFKRVPPGFAASLHMDGAEGAPLLRLTVADAQGSAQPAVDYACDYVILATGGELNPVSDDRLTVDGTIIARRRRLEQQVSAVMANASSALVIGGGLTGVELAAELAEHLGPGRVTLAVGPTRKERGFYPGDPGAGLLPGFRDTRGLRLGLRLKLRKLQLRGLGDDGGAVRYCGAWLQRHGVRVLERWAVPPPVGSTLADMTAAARPPCARSWRDAGDAGGGISWEEAGPDADLPADAVFDCRGLRPNTRESYTSYDGPTADAPAAAAKVERLGLPRECVAPSGWLWVDDKFRLAAPLTGNDANVRIDADAEGRVALAAVAGGRVYVVGDAAEKDKQERTAANAHAEGEYAALDILEGVRGRRPLPPFVAPPRLCAISLGKWDGLVVLGRWVALRGVLAALAKQVLQWYFVNFLPLPYWLMRRLPGKQPRRYGGSAGASPEVLIARTGGRAIIRRAFWTVEPRAGWLSREGRTSDPSMMAGATTRTMARARAHFPRASPRASPRAPPPSMLASRVLPAAGGSGGAFARLLASVALTDAELACIDATRVRTVLRAAACVARDEAPTVRDGFAVLYADFPVLRPAGDYAVRALALECEHARRRARELSAPFAYAPLEESSEAVLPLLRRYFDAIDMTRTGSLDLENLEAACAGKAGTFGAAVAKVCLEEECALDEHSSYFTGASFSDFVGSVSRRPALRDDLRRLSALDEECLLDSEAAARSAVPNDQWAQRHAASFDEMAATVRHWERSPTMAALLTERVADRRRTRLATILRGCFDGASKHEIVEALKVVYCDSPQLRAAGTIVFKLMETFVGSHAKYGSWREARDEAVPATRDKREARDEAVPRVEAVSEAVPAPRADLTSSAVAVPHLAAAAVAAPDLAVAAPALASSFVTAAVTAASLTTIADGQKSEVGQRELSALAASEVAKASSSSAAAADAVADAERRLGTVLRALARTSDWEQAIEYLGESQL